jgi:hypothetical protein
LDYEGAVFVGGVKALSGNPFILGRIRVIRESACVRNVGESVWRRVGAIGCGETGYGGW